MSAAIAKALKLLKYIRLGFSTVKSQDKDKKGGWVFLIGVVVLLFLLPSVAVTIPGLLGKAGEMENITGDVTQTQLYQKICSSYEKYIRQYEEKAEKRAEEVKKDHAYTVTKKVISADGEEMEIQERKYPEVSVVTNFSSPLKSYVLAYISVKHVDVEKWDYDEKEIQDFLASITSYEESITKQSQAAITYTAYTDVKPPEEIAALFFKNREDQEMYLFSASAFAEFDISGDDYAAWDGTLPSGGGSLGWVSRLYETGRPEGVPGLISSGKGDHGGKSYGTCQFSITMGSLQSFVAWLRSYDAQLYAPLAGLPVGSGAFDAAWKQLAKTHQKEFAAAQNLCVYQMHGRPWVKNAKAASGIDFTRSYALEEMAFSRGVQHGGGGAMSVFSRAGISSSDDDTQIISKFYQYLHDHVDTYWSKCDTSNKRGVASRMLREKQTLLSLVGKTRPGSETEEEKEDGKPAGGAAADQAEEKKSEK